MTDHDIVDVLLVEDNAHDAEITMRALSKLSHRVHWVRDGEEAIEYLRVSALPRLVLLDLKMPKMSGIDVLRELRSTDRTVSIPVVMLTSSGQERDIAECYRYGANGFAVKPIDLQELEGVVQRIGLYWLLVNRPPEPGGLRRK